MQLGRAVARARLGIVCAFVIVTVLASLVCFVLLPDAYTTSTTLYILGSQGESLTSDALQAGALLVDDCRELATSKRVTAQVADHLLLKDLSDFKIEVSARKNTRLLDISVTGADPLSVTYVAAGLGNALTECAAELLHADGIAVVDPAEVPSAPSGPPRELYIGLAALLSLVVSVLVAVIRGATNKALWTAEDVQRETGIPVLGQFPFAQDVKKGGRR